MAAPPPASERAGADVQTPLQASPGARARSAPAEPHADRAAPGHTVAVGANQRPRPACGSPVLGPGAFGLYDEDASVVFDNVAIIGDAP